MQTTLSYYTAQDRKGSGMTPGAPPRFLPALSQWILLSVTLVVYLGAMPYLILFSPHLLYGVYLVIIGAVASILFFDWPQVRGLQWVTPYLTWVALYCYWGAVVAPPGMPLEEVAKLCLKTLLIIVGFALAVTGRNSLRRFASWVQVAALVNVAVAIWEVSHPELILKLARAHDPMATAFNVERPAGIWSNPDEASFGYLFALLISCWGRGPLIWVGRIGCIVGIYLTASRTGAYVLLSGCLILLVGRMVNIRWRPGTAAASILGVLLLCSIGVVALHVAPIDRFDLSKNRQIMRILDFAETDLERSGDLGRMEIARAAAFQALNGPWYGHGIYTFQLEARDPFSVLKVGAHNLYITVWGETGFPGGLTYFLLLMLGLSRLASPLLSKEDRLPLVVLWIGYLVVGLTWHNQVTSFAGMLYSGSLWHLPGILRQR